MIKIELANADMKEKLKLKNEAFIVTQKDELLGFCAFALTPPEVQIERADCEDMGLLDGLIRQTMSYALDHDCRYALFEKDVKQKAVLLKILKECEQSLDILTFFTNLNHCENIL